MIQFYASEIGVDLIFALTNADGTPLLDVPDSGWPKLYVDGLSASPITLIATGAPGEYHHVVPAAEWPVPASEVIHYYQAYIEFHNSTPKTVLTDEFLIAVILKPTVALS